MGRETQSVFLLLLLFFLFLSDVSNGFSLAVIYVFTGFNLGYSSSCLLLLPFPREDMFLDEESST